jgi:hypothetical protein
MNRRHFIVTGVDSGFAAATFGRPAIATAGQMEVFKSLTCGCYSAWVDHMSRAGFDALVGDVDQETLRLMKARASVTLELSSCYTAFIEG